MRLVALLLVVVALAITVPVFAQGAFTDVPSDHWAYDAVNTLQSAGLVQGYPDGTFQGKRTLSRYEFAMVIARLLPLIPGGGPQISPSAGVTQAQLDAALANKADRSELGAFASKADLDAVSRLVNEFSDELAALGVDVNNLKNEITGIKARLDAIEKELARVRFTGNFNVAGIVTDSTEGFAVDADSRPFGTKDTIKNVGFIRDFDLNIAGRVNDSTTAMATINFGNYLNYYNSGETVDTSAGSVGDSFFPYYMYVSTDTSIGDLSIGRFPLQLTPYTFKMIDFDTYIDDWKTDNGNYPVDGIKLDTKLFGLDWLMFAAKNDNNSYFNGLTSQPVFTLLNNGTGFAGGQLTGTTQSAGVHTALKLPWATALGLTYYQAWNNDDFLANNYDKVTVMGADVAIPISAVTLKASVNEATTSGDDLEDVDYRNAAYDYSANFDLFDAGIGVGWKRIGENYTAAGYWDKIGRWYNPSMIEGFYGSVDFDLSSKINLYAKGEFLKFTDSIDSGYETAAVTTAGFPIDKDDKVNNYKAGLAWSITGNDTISFDYEQTNFELARITAPGTDSKEKYFTVGWGKKLGTNANLKASYQLIEYNAGSAFGPYGNEDYKGGLGVVQLGFSF